MGGPVEEYGVRYVGLTEALREETRTLVNMRYGAVPTIRYEMGVCFMTDMPDARHAAIIRRVRSTVATCRCQQLAGMACEVS